MYKVKFVLDVEAFKENVMLSDGMADTMKQHAKTIKDRCGKGYYYFQNKGRGAQMALVMAISEDAQVDNSENNTLLRAIY